MLPHGKLHEQRSVPDGADAFGKLDRLIEGGRRCKPDDARAVFGHERNRFLDRLIAP